MRLLSVPREQLGEVWPEVRHWIDAAADHSGGWWDEGIILDRIADGVAWLWVISDGRELHGAVVTEVEDAPSGRSTAIISICGGKDMRRWLHLISGIEAWARRIGCEAIEVRGRKGWERVLEGYAPVSVTLRKELTNERGKQDEAGHRAVARPVGAGAAAS